MPSDLPIRCSCGALTGAAHDVSAHHGNRVVCYCNDCQSFAHFLGRPDDVLDEFGGTDIFQMCSDRLRLDGGAGHLACMRLTPRGLMRWYANCCNTPIGNTLATARIPFVGLVHSCVDTEGRELDALIGPVRAGVHGRRARTGPGGEAPNAHATTSVSQIFRVTGRLLAWWLRGDRRRSPFFDGQSGRPAAIPRVLSPEELRDVTAARGRWPGPPGASDPFRPNVE